MAKIWPLRFLSDRWISGKTPDRQWIVGALPVVVMVLVKTAVLWQECVVSHSERVWYVRLPDPVCPRWAPGGMPLEVVSIVPRRIVQSMVVGAMVKYAARGGCCDCGVGAVLLESTEGV